jgi:hypothetical protein
MNNKFEIKNKRILKNGTIAGYVKQNDGSWKWRFVKKNTKGGSPNNNNNKNNNNKNNSENELDQNELYELYENNKFSYNHPFKNIKYGVFEGLYSGNNNNNNNNNNNSNDKIYIFRNDNNCFVFKMINDSFKAIYINVHPLNKFDISFIEFLKQYTIKPITNKNIRDKFLNFLEKSKFKPKQN